MKIHMLFIGVFTLFLSVHFAELSAQQTPEQASVQAVDTSVELKVKGIGCAMDVKSIAEHVEELQGVSSCISLNQGATTTFKIDFDPNLADLRAIRTQIEATPGCDDPKSRPYKVK